VADGDSLSATPGRGGLLVVPPELLANTAAFGGYQPEPHLTAWTQRERRRPLVDRPLPDRHDNRSARAGATLLAIRNKTSSTYQKYVVEPAGHHRVVSHKAHKRMRREKRRIAPQ
jgi:hypothetical protein